MCILVNILLYYFVINCIDKYYTKNNLKLDYQIIYIIKNIYSIKFIL